MPRAEAMVAALGSELSMWALAFALGLASIWLLAPFFTGFAEFLHNGVVMGVAALAYSQLARVIDDSLDQSVPTIAETGPRMALGPALGVSVVGTGLAVGGSVVLSYAMQALGVEVQEQARVLSILESKELVQVVALGLGALLVAPIAEELLFRGLLFRRLALRLGAWQPGAGVGVRAHPVATALAYLASGLPFAAIHLNLSGLVIYVWLGSVFAWTYQRSGRLACAMLVHFASNAVTLANLLWGAYG